MRRKEIEKLLNGLNGSQVFNVWDDVKLTGLGFTKEILMGRGGNSNIIYSKDDCDYVVAMVDSVKQGERRILLLDKDFYDTEIKKKCILLKSHSYMNKQYRSVIGGKNKEGKATNLSVHRLALGVTDSKVEVDHIAMSDAVCIREFLRPVNTIQNNYNKPYRTKVKGNRFELLTAFMSESIKEDVISMGYELLPYRAETTYKIKSQRFEDMEEMYRAINILEDKVFGEYRYNPLVACEDNTDLCLMLEWKLAGSLTEEEFYEAKRMKLQKQHEDDDFCKFYNI